MHLDHILIGDTRIKWALSDLREAIRRDSAAIREDAVTETRERPSPAPTPEESAREAQSKVHEFRRLQSAAYHASGDERKAAECACKAFDDYRGIERGERCHFASPNTTPRPGKTAATPATYMKRPNNNPPRRKRTRSAGAKPKARPTSSTDENLAGFNRPRTTQRGTSA